MLTIRLPLDDGSTEPFTLPDVTPIEPGAGPFNRVAFAAAHVASVPDDPDAIDWDTTLRYREYLWECGLGVAEAMDTAQRGMGLSWPLASELIRRTAGMARTRTDALVACGCGTDQLDDRERHDLDAIARAYEEQMQVVEGAGGRVILMASRVLRAAARSADDYRAVYGRLLSRAQQPVLLHWLGPMFDPALAGYWGHDDLDAAADVVLSIIEAHQEQVDGIKMSLLDRDREVSLRRRLPPRVRMYTGDDFDFADLIAGDEHGHSDALLGIFDAIAPAASAALAALARGDRDRYEAILGPCVPLSRHVFAAPTRFYKTGLVFLAWLNGHQESATMLRMQHMSRSLVHQAQTFRLAAAAGLLRDPSLAVERMRRAVREAGLDA